MARWGGRDKETASTVDGSTGSDSVERRSLGTLERRNWGIS